MKVVVCGSYGDLETFRIFLNKFQKEYGKGNVFPTEVHLKRSEKCIEAHHKGKGETPETLKLRSKLMDRYFKKIDECDIVYIVNWKNGSEHYGAGTLMELGYAYAKKKKIMFYLEPLTEANVVSLTYLLEDEVEKKMDINMKRPYLHSRSTK